MQCNGWSTTSRFLRTCTRRNFTASSHQWQTDLRTRCRSYAAVAHKRSLPSVMTPKPPSISSLPPAQVSRVASQSIRISAKGDTFLDAYYILNSIRYSIGLIQQHSSSKILTPSSHKPPPQDPFIDFGQPIPVRLATHCLLHGLIREKLFSRAARQASLMMADGTRIHTKTLETIIAGNTSGRNKFITDIPKSWFSSRSISLDKLVVSDRCTRIAVQLLKQARNHRQERSEKMYDIVIKACLLQGEILVASLFFMILVKDWQLRQAAKTREEAVAAIQHATQDSSDLEAQTVAGIYPSRSLLIPILQHIERDLAEEPPDSSPFQISIQALANLARILDERQFYTDHFAMLIKVMYSVPKSNAEVWTGPPGHPKKVNAYDYFHEVLERLISRICARKTKPAAPVRWYRDVTNSRSTEVLPIYEPFEFDAPTYNSLIHYALVHRLSPRIADRLMKRMTRQGPGVDIATYNTLLRSSTILRMPEISEQVINVLRRTHATITDDRTRGSAVLAYGESAKLTPLPEDGVKPNTSRFDRILLELRNTDITVPPMPTTQDGMVATILTDKYTLTAFISHLTSTGQPHVVAELLWHLLPELLVVDFPPGRAHEPDRASIRRASREASIKRAVTYGPYVFTVILNALAKAGKTGLAERVWILAKDAERASWIPEFVEGVEPWCLPIHAYTCMIQCYAAEGRRGMDLKRSLGYFDTAHKWEPKSSNHVRGWAKFVYEGAQVAVRYRKRRSAARVMAVLLHNSMQSGADAVCKALKVLQETEGMQLNGKHIMIPRPDARYFNAVLSLFGRQPHMYARSVKSKKSKWRWAHKRAMRRYEKTGVKSAHWHPRLQEVVQEIVRCGYEVPWGYRYMFVGRYRPETWEGQKKCKLEKRPWAYPDPRPRFHPYRIPTVKTRGLPVGRTSVARRRLRTT